MNSEIQYGLTYPLTSRTSLMLKKYNFLVMSEPSILDFSDAQKIQLSSVVKDINPS